jgi:hypothetical protein
MGKLKPWQIALIALGLVVGIGSFAWSMLSGNEIRRPDSLLLVDTATGDRFRADMGGKRSLILPAKHPSTGLRTILRLEERDGGWFVQGPSLVADLPEAQRAAIRDLESGAVTVSDAPVQPLRR